jgi:hypothetical protein
MTRRAIIIGLLASAVFAGIGFFNDMVLRQTFLFSTYMPPFVYGLVILVVLLLPSLLKRISPRLPLRRSELAVIIVLTFPACFVAGRTLIHHFPGVIVTPRHYNEDRLGWQRYELLRRVPPIMLAGHDPEFGAADIRQPEALASRLRAIRGGAGGPLARQLAPGLPEAGVAIPAAPAPLARTLNRLIRQPDLFESADLQGNTLPLEARRLLDTGFRNAHERRCFNRMVLDSAFPQELRSWAEQEDLLVNGFQMGLGEGPDHIPVGDVPWRGWARTLLTFWAPLLLALAVAYIGLALVMHRQWYEHERLPFPIAKFAASILPDEGAVENRGLFRSRAFWISAGVVAFWHLNNYAALWWPGTLIAIPRAFNLETLAKLIPVQWATYPCLMSPTLYFTIIGIAYLISSEASLSVGLAPYVYAIFAGVMLGYGIEVGAGIFHTTRISNYVMLGGYSGMFLMLLYYGRRHLVCVVQRCLGRVPGDEVRPHEYWGGRAFLCGGLAFVLILRVAGIELLWGLWYLAMLLVVYTVVARIVAETGMILIHPCLYPAVLATGLFGGYFVGLDQMVPMAIVSTVIGVGCHVVMLPLMTQGFGIVREHHGKVALWCTVSLVIALAVAIPTALYLQYDYGAVANSDGWTRALPHTGLDAAETVATNLDVLGLLTEEGAAPVSAPPERSLFTRPAFIAFAIALAGALIFELARLRLKWWPFHPIMFVVLDFYISRELAASFLIGWVVKQLVSKYGGARYYGRVKPVMLGLIAGDMLAQFAITGACAVYSLSTGDPPQAYWVLPG